MDKGQFFRFRVWFTVVVTALLASVLSYQYYHGGIPAHHLLADKNLPKISNIWGLLTIPVSSFFLLWRVDRRIFENRKETSIPKNFWISMLSALAFGILLGISVEFGLKSLTDQVPFILLLLALLFPIYRAECLLGFILGLTYFIGGVLPLVVGGVFTGLAAIIYIYLRGSVIWLYGRVVR